MDNIVWPQKRSITELYKKYGLFLFIGEILNLLVTKVFFKQAKILRLPFIIKNRQRISIGLKFSAGKNLVLDVVTKNGEILIGNNCVVAENLSIYSCSLVRIGNNVLISRNVYITDHSHGNYSNDFQSDPIIPPNERNLFFSKVEIGNNVWIGEGVKILKGVTIGSGSIIGAGSIVTKDLPPNVIAAGNPLKIIKKFDEVTRTWVRAEL